MIKNFETYINEDYFSKLASRKDNGTARKENEFTEDFVRSFVRDGRENYIKSITIRKENDKFIVDIDGDFFLESDVERIPFQLGKVTGSFSCAKCKNLTSLEGCPKEVGRFFYCSYCENLTSLESCPREVGGNFDCGFCKNLTSLEGCPEKVDGDFNCSNCEKLTSLKGCPREVGGSFDCWDCCKQFTKDDVKSLCNVKGNIYL